MLFKLWLPGALLLTAPFSSDWQFGHLLAIKQAQRGWKYLCKQKYGTCPRSKNQNGKSITNQEENFVPEAIFGSAGLSAKVPV
ncbi:MAG TPA: hypothetical protein VFA02_00450 [Pseudacidobacterium sp.]|nr:hypothetical protein [Pseudacidobacterium sp.]